MEINSRKCLLPKQWQTNPPVARQDFIMHQQTLASKYALRPSEHSRRVYFPLRIHVNNTPSPSMEMSAIVIYYSIVLALPNRIY